MSKLLSRVGAELDPRLLSDVKPITTECAAPNICDRASKSLNSMLTVGLVKSPIQQGQIEHRFDESELPQSLISRPPEEKAVSVVMPDRPPRKRTDTICRIGGDTTRSAERTQTTRKLVP